MRTFMALELPDELRGEVAAVSRSLARVCDGRFVPYENLHLTLAFLGEVDEAGASSAIGALEAACAGTGCVTLMPTGLGKFGRASDATLWMGFEATPELRALDARLREELGARGLTYDEKTFLPHVTLARRARIPKGALPELPFPMPAEACHVTLFRSRLDRAGATYKPLHTAALGPSR